MVNQRTAELDARAAELSSMYQQKCDAARAAGVSVPPEVIKSFMSEHNKLSVAYGTLPRNNGQRARPNKMPPDAIIVTEQISQSIRNGHTHAPPYFLPSDVPVLTLALIKKVHYLRNQNPEGSEARRKADKLLMDFQVGGLIPPQGIDALNLYNNSPTLVRENSHHAGTKMRQTSVPPRPRSSKNRANTHVSSLQDKLAYIAAASRLIELCIELHENVIEPWSASPAERMQGGFDVDSAYNRIENVLKAVGLHDYVEKERKQHAKGRTPLEFETQMLKQDNEPAIKALRQRIQQNPGLYADRF